MENINLIQEPVERWQNMYGANLLDLLYNKPRRWSFTFQSYVFLTLIDKHLGLNVSQARLNVMERSIYSANYVFVENLFSKFVILFSDFF